jgi:hypothetical protein
MTLFSPNCHRRDPIALVSQRSIQLIGAIAFLFLLQMGARPLVAQGPSAGGTPDVLVLSNGDTLHGKLVNETGGKVNRLGQDQGTTHQRQLCGAR